MAQNYLRKTQDRIEEIELAQLLLGLRNHWCQTVLLCAALAMSGFLFSYFTYVPTYTSSTTFVVSNKTGGVLNESDSLTSSDLSASTTLADTFQYILLSDEAMLSVIKMYQLDTTVEQLKDCIHIAPVSKTNILQMRVVTESALLSKNIADRIIEYYPEVLARTLKSASLEVLNWPRIAPQADPYNGFFFYPFFGLLLAIVISVAIVYIKILLVDTIKTVSDIGNRLNMNVMASIPKVVCGNKKKRNQAGLFIAEPSSGFTFTESFKALRTKVEMISEKKGYKTFVISSSLESEGKTTIAINLSAALAGNGKKVLLIDADLKKPSIYRYMGLTHDIGIDRVLRGDASCESAVVQSEKYGFSVLLSIHEVPNSSELLSSSSMKDLVACVRGQYDYVIMDSTPAGVLTDSAVITSYTDAVILAVRQDYAPASLIDSALQSLSENRAELIGCIFNIVDERGTGFGGYRYGKYGKYGGYGKYGRYETCGSELKVSK